MNDRRSMALVAFLVVLCLPGPRPVEAQAAEGTLRGRVVDAQTGDPLPGAVIAIPEADKGVWVQEHGEYVIEGLAPGPHSVECTHIGYDPQHLEVVVRVGEEVELNVSLVARAIRLSAVTVTPSRFAIMGREPHARQVLTEEEIQAIPHFGEDIYRAVARLPGISATDFSAKFTVRGGEHDEVLVLLDGVQLYDPFHLKDINGGVVSIVDVEVIEGIDLLTGGFPAEYGDRTSGVFNIRSRTPEPGRERHSVGLSFMNARAMSEGTFERGSWLVSARRGYLDLVLWLMNEDEDVSPNYYDVLGKVEYELSPQHRLSAHVLHSRDDFDLVEDDADESTTGYGNSYAWLNLRSAIGPSLAVHTSLVAGRITDDRQGVATTWVGNEERPDFTVADERSFRVLGLKQDWNWEASPNHYVKWGIDLRRLQAEYDYLSTDQRYTWLSRDSLFVAIDTTAVNRSPTANGVASYAAYRVRLAPPLTFELGLRYDHASHTDDRLLSPRLNFVYNLSPATTLRGGWGEYYQTEGIHEIGVEDGEDEFFEAEHAQHLVLGLQHRFPNQVDLRLEAYRKKLSDQRPSYRNWQNGIEIFPELQSDRLRVEGQGLDSRGLEIYVKRDTGGKVTWWASYALARVRERVGSISTNHGTLSLNRRIAGIYDQRHTAYFDINYRPSAPWRLNLAWQYHSGWPYTPQVLYHVTEGGNDYYYSGAGEPHGKRFAAYHRLDLKTSRRFETSRGLVSTHLEFVNLYNRGNVSGYDYDWRCTDAGGCWLEESPEYWFRLLPSIGVSWSWGQG